MLAMVWLAAAWILLAVGGPAAATRELATTRPDVLSLGGDYYTPAFGITQAVSIAFGVAMFPQVNQRFFVAHSKTILKRTFALWPVLVLALFVPAFMLGAWARGPGIEVTEGANVLPLLLAEYTPAWFAALVIAGAVAAMMSSSDSMLLSGSAYFTRDLYRPFVDPEASERREDRLGRVGVVVFAILAFLASLGRPGTLLEVGATAFGGFAQLALPVIVAPYWTGTTRAGITAGIVASQAFYLASVLLAALPMAYGGWGASIVGMAIGLVLTSGVSRFTAPASREDAAIYFDLADAERG